MLNIIGLGGTAHSFSACMLKDGIITHAIEDERLNGTKHSLFSERNMELARCRAAEYCMKASGITFNDVDYFITSSIINKLYYARYEKKTIIINHHLAHASSVFYTSPFEESAVLVVDGCGSGIGLNHRTDEQRNESISFYYASDTYINEIHKVSGHMSSSFFPYHSIGEFYHTITKAIGFNFLDEGKTMGLAPYGQSKYVQDFARFYKVDDEGYFVRNQKHMLEMNRFLEHELNKVVDEEHRFQTIADIAYAGQYHLEYIMVKLCQALYNKTRSKNLCLAGGVTLNSAANYRILKDTPFENIYIFPQAGDTGIAIGSAYYGYYQLKNKPRIIDERPFSPYLGRVYEHEEFEAALKQYSDQINIEAPCSLYERVAELIAQGKIVGWYNGRSEIGPRALGNRSILADPRNPAMKDIINSRIKHREHFRPFAPIVLEEAQTEYFDLDEPSYYMLMISPIKHEKQAVIPSVTHVDGTGRVQTVSPDLNPNLYNLLVEFEKITGVPVLLNTSFNDNGQPIVETPLDAIKTFLTIDLDYLVMNGNIISKKNKK